MGKLFNFDDLASSTQHAEPAFEAEATKVVGYDSGIFAKVSL